MRKQNLFGRFLATFLAVVMVLSCVPVSVFATQTDEVPAPDPSEEVVEPVDTPVGLSLDEEGGKSNEENEEEKKETPAPTVTDISEVLEATEGTFTVKGVVTLVNGQNYYVQDGTGAICVRLSATRSDIDLGATIQVTGTLAVEDGETLLIDSTVDALQNSQVTIDDTPTDVIPTPVADTPAGGKNYSQTTTLTTGDYVIVAAYDGKYYALGTTIGNKILPTEVTVVEGKLTGADLPTWTITAGDGTATLNNGTNYLGYNSGTNFKKSTDAANWTVTENNGTFQFTIDTRAIAYGGEQGKFGAYATSNVTNNKYQLYLTLFGEGASQPVKETVATPTGTASGDVKVGDTVEFSCATEGATLMVKVDDGDYTAYTGPITISKNTTIKVKATKEGMNDSAETSFTYRAYEMKTQYTLAETIAAGDKVAIYNPESKKVMTSEGYTYTNKTGATKEELKTADASVTEKVLTTTSDKLAVMTVSVDDDENYTFAIDSKYLLLDGTNVQFADEQGDYTLFALESATDGYYIKSTNAKYNGNAQYLQLFSGYFTCYSFNKDNAGRYLVQFYKETEVKSYLDEQGSTEPDPEPEKPTAVDYTLTGTIADGDTVVMYNATSGTLLSSTASGYKLAGVAATPAENVISTADTTVAWVVGKDADGNYTFTQGDKVLGMVKSGSYVNLSTKASDNNTTWALESSATDKVFYVKNTKMPADSTYGDYYLEYFTPEAGTGGFTACASTAPSDDKFGISFYKLGGGSGSEEEKPSTSTIADGNYVIWNPTHNVAVSNTFNSSNYMLGTSVTPVGDTVTGYGSVDIWTVKNNTDGTFTISQNGKYFGNNASGYIVVEETPANPNWKLTTLDDGTTYLSNTGSGKDLEWYANFSDWSMYYYKEADKALYALKFTPATAVYDTDSDVVSDIAQWGGGGPYDATTNATKINGDRYVVGDQKDTNATFTIQANGKAGKPYQVTNAGGIYMGGEKIGASAGDYMQFAVNTAGWGDMTLAFRMRATAAAPGSFQLCYSTDGGTTWNNFDTGSYAYAYYNYATSENVSKAGSITDGVAKPSLATTYYVSFSFDVPAGAENCKNLLIRLVAGTTRADSGTGNISGNIRIDNVSLSGSPIVSDGITGYVSVTPDGSEDQAEGTELTMTSTAEGATIYYRVDGGEWKTYDPENKPTLEKLPCDIEAYAKATDKQDSVVRLYHYAAGTVGTVKMTPNGGSVWVPKDDEPVQVTLSTATEGATIYYAIADENGNYELEDGNVKWKVYTEETTISLEKGFASRKMKAYAVKEGFTDSSVNEKTFTERGSETFNIYFGQLHSHTTISDGSGDIDDAYEHGQKVENLDFLAVTDHSNSFDNATSGVLAEDASKVSEEWKLAKETAANYTTEDFVGLYGYEMTWSNGLGHMNTYNTPGFQSRTQSDYSTYATALKNYYDTLTTVTDSISQFNHPGTTFGDFQDFAYYSEKYDDLITLIEVGNGEGAIGSSGYFPSYEYYTRALDKGWHVAPTNNQDNHKGQWGSANTARSVVLADSLTESAIYDAMRNYRVYATEDNDLNIYYTLDGNIMGSILDAKDEDENVNIRVLLSDATDGVAGTKVQVIVNGGLVAASTTIEESKTRTNEKQEEVTFTVPANYSYYYIKVVQADGDIAVTAPVWMGEVESVGISSFTTDAAVAVQDQEMNLTLELYNNVKSPLEITSIEFKLSDDDKAEAFHTADLTKLGKVPAMGTASYSFSYTHKTVGKTQIYAVVKGTLNGVEKKYIEKLELTFVPEKMVSRVIVDGTHYNDYVTGYYGGNINNLTTIAAESQIEVSIVKDEITADMLENCQLLIISAPAKKADTAGAGDYVPKPFEDSFLKLVTDYVQKGGSVVVCGLADYQDKSATSADNHTAAQLNKLLKAIGSTMTINDDEVLDDKHNGGQAYRLYPTNFNMESKWCKGIVETTEEEEGQQYSQYSGCSVNPGNGTWLVKGFDTTLGVDSDKDGVGNNGETFSYSDGTNNYSYNVVTKKGDVVFLAAEDTGHGGTIFAAGGVFVSDFEVKAELDNIWDLPYANRTIIENILGVVKKELPLSTIAEMRKGELGEVFRIQGYATSGTTNPDTTFFDAIYLQDETGGTTVFPFSVSGVTIGTPIEIVGYVDAYQGDKEIQVMSYKILDTDSKIYKPEKMSNKDAMDYDKNGGKLIQVEGEVVEVTLSGETGVAQFVVKDEKGDKAKVFIDGYILSGTTGKNELASTVKLGTTVSAVGLLYMHPEGASDVSVPVLRVRNCDEVKAVGGTGTETETKHDVKVTVQGKGTATVEPATAKKGEIVTIKTNPNDGYAVKSITVNGGKITVTAGKDGKYTFPMPDGDVEVKVTFEETYNVFIKDSKYGTITVSDETPFAGDKVTITIKPVSGKQVNSVKVVDEDGNRVKVTSKDGKWTFTMPESDVTVSATFKQASSKTGDTSHVYLYVGIMVVAVLALVVLILGRKKWFKK